jgi:O-antigen/teichoic acid export membrane protein
MSRPLEHGGNPHGKLLGHGAAYTLASAAQVVSGLVVLPIVTRLLAPEAYGVVATAVVVLQLLGLVAALGLPAVIVLECFEPDGGIEKARRLATSAVLGAILVALCADLTGPVWSQVFGDVDYGPPLRLAVWGTVPLAALGAAQGILRAEGRPLSYVGATVVATLGGQLLGLLALAMIEETPTAYLAGVVAGSCAGATWALSRARVHPLRPADRHTTRRGLGVALPTVPHTMSLFLLFAVDRVMVERYEGLTEVARYQVAYLVGAAGMSLFAAVNNAWAPVVLASPAPERWEVLAKTSRTLTRLAALVVGATALAAPLMLRIAAPPSYDPGSLADVATLVAASVLPYVLYISCVHVVFAERRTRWLAVTTPVAAIVNVALNVVMVPAFGLAGAAAASFLSYGVLAAITWALSRSVVHVAWDLSDRVVVWAGAGLVVALALVLPTDGGTWLVLRGAAATVLGLSVLAVAVATVRAERRQGPADLGLEVL